ncbi:hypothetical protein OKT23_17240 [Providencia rettgeri]|uniref:hypothetical protein n=1 Tax=Providencia TaxID=586 RepID=UPI00227115EF|nr:MULTISPECIES: hypothetical protein [Providencia]MCX9097010.1 hypothetical protein [Providencia rettgeri]MCX9126489.1 hypothetical protein [Providencia rettgeri]MCX9129861.1 hypothetical protein [Providencia rettgeri]HEM6846616.1 hypothetical protein [Providencia rettgeri]
MKYIIGSGWWCTDDKNNNRDRYYGDDTIRSAAFHREWLASITENTYSVKICIIDSNSPIKPPLLPNNIIFISLNENGGHATQHTGKYSGWMRSVLHSMSYAQNSDCEYYVYVEQDVLLFGDGIIEFCISKMKKPYMFGKCNLFNNPLQQSFFIIKKDYIDIFLSNIYSIKYRDSQINPEKKFAISTSRLYKFIPKFIFLTPKNRFLKKLTWRFQNILCKLFGNYQYLPVGYGRDRPINFDDSYYYFQHASRDEINEYKSRKS